MFVIFVLRRYGDIHAVTPAERMYSVVTMLLGACGIGIVLSNVTSLLGSLNAYAHALSVKLHEVCASPLGCFTVLAWAINTFVNHKRGLTAYSRAHSPK